MIKLIKKFSEIKSGDLVYVCIDKINLDYLKNLKFSINVLNDIKDKIKDKKNISLSYFIGENNIENLNIIYFDSKSGKNIYEYLGGIFNKLSLNLNILVNNDKFIIEVVDTLILSKYKFQKYLSKKEINSFKIILDNKEIKLKIEERLKTLENIINTREIVETAACDKTPDKYIELIKSIKFKNTKLKILDYKKIQKLGLGLIEAVGKASDYKPNLVILERIIDKKLPTIGLVGKGVTYDTGGLNIKTDAHMFPMKEDMAGSAVTLYTMKNLDRFKDLNVNIIIAMPIVENSVSGNAYRPGDIIKSYNGKTVEIHNTDAEGRLILADAMSYISKNYKLDTIITIATLTGACMHAIGHNYAGIMGNNRQIIDKLLKESQKDFEKYWELPFSDFFVEKAKGTISDLKNLSSEVKAGASMGAGFLANFCDNNESFVHIDIAGVAAVPENYGLYTKGATGFGVDSLSKLFIQIL